MPETLSVSSFKEGLTSSSLLVLASAALTVEPQFTQINVCFGHLFIEEKSPLFEREVLN